MKRIILLFLSAGAIVAVGIFIGLRTGSPLSSDSRLNVAVSFYPLAEFAEKVGGTEVAVVNIVPPGAEPHDFEPSAQDIAKVYSADLFIFNGSGFDPWAEQISPELEKRGIAVIAMTEHFDLLEGEDEHGEEEGELEHEGEGLDPHIWLDPILARKEVEIIRDALVALDPLHSGIYEANATEYLAELSALDREYADGLASCAMRDIVASHGAFGYLAKRYDLHVVHIAGLSPEEEPSPKKMAEIAEFARERKIKYIFFETLVSPKLAETIAAEIGAETLVFNPIEGLTKEDLLQGKNYISVMKENLSALSQALSCK